MLDAANFVDAIQQRQGLYVSCLEEIAFRRGYITREQLREAAVRYGKSDYGRYLLQIADTVEE